MMMPFLVAVNAWKFWEPIDLAFLVAAGQKLGTTPRSNICCSLETAGTNEISEDVFRVAVSQNFESEVGRPRSTQGAAGAIVQTQKSKKLWNRTRVSEGQLRAGATTLVRFQTILKHNLKQDLALRMAEFCFKNSWLMQYLRFVWLHEGCDPIYLVEIALREALG